MNPVASALLALLVLTASAQAEDFATIPYAKLHNAFQRAAKVNAPNLRGIVAISSRNKAIKASSITLTINSKSGAREVPVDFSGELRSFPLSAELLKENPPVVTNQPSGTVQLGGGIGIEVPEGQSYSYQQLSDLLRQGYEELKRRGGLFAAAFLPTPKGLVFLFTKPAAQTMTIALKAGPKILTVDEAGGIELVIDRAAVAENPTVTMSERPAKMFLDF